jgi:hypothetical protein
LKREKNKWIEIIRKTIEEYPVLSLISPKNYKNLILSLIKTVESKKVDTMLEEYLIFMSI